MPSPCSFCGESQKAWRPSSQRATMTENSAAKSTPASATAGSSPIASQAASASLRRADPGLALAVIAVAPGLEDERQRRARRPRALTSARLATVAPRRDARAALLDELLSPRRGPARWRASACRAAACRRAPRAVRPANSRIRRSRRRPASPKRCERLGVVERRAREIGGDVGRAGMLVRVEDVAVVAELRRRDRQHPAELAAADDADGGAGRDRHSGASATDPVCSSRHASSRARERVVAASRASPRRAARR